MNTQLGEANIRRIEKSERIKIETSRSFKKARRETGPVSRGPFYAFAVLRRLTWALAIRLETNLVFQGISSDQLDRRRADGPHRKRDTGMSRFQVQRIREWCVPASLSTGI